MTRLVTRGFESGVLADEVDASVSAAIVTSTPTPRTGTYCIRLTGQNDQIQYNFAATDVLYGGFGLYLDDNSGSSAHDLILVGSGDSNLTFRWTTSNNITVYRNGTWIATSGPNVFVLKTWHYIECYFKLANSGGRVQIKVDGTDVVDFTGDTMGGSDPSMTVLTMQGLQGVNPLGYDDVVWNDERGSVNNGFPGIISLTPLFPDAAGDNTALVRGGTDSGNNWDQVDEVPADAVSYVYGTGSGQYDLYGLDNFVPPTGAFINAVIVQGRSQIDAGAGNMKLMLKAGSTEAESTGTFPLLTGWNAYSFGWEENPDTVGPWTESDVNSLQAGFKAE